MRKQPGTIMNYKDLTCLLETHYATREHRITSLRQSYKPAAEILLHCVIALSARPIAARTAKNESAGDTCPRRLSSCAALSRPPDIATAAPTAQNQLQATTDRRCGSCWWKIPSAWRHTSATR